MAITHQTFFHIGEVVKNDLEIALSKFDGALKKQFLLNILRNMSRPDYQILEEASQDKNDPINHSDEFETIRALYTNPEQMQILKLSLAEVPAAKLAVLFTIFMLVQKELIALKGQLGESVEPEDQDILAVREVLPQLQQRANSFQIVIPKNWAIEHGFTQENAMQIVNRRHLAYGCIGWCLFFS